MANSSVLMDAQKVIAACDHMIETIIASRTRAREEAILEAMCPPRWFGVARTREEAEHYVDHGDLFDRYWEVMHGHQLRTARAIKAIAEQSTTGNVMVTADDWSSIT